jgi:hypothetical protein
MKVKTEEEEGGLYTFTTVKYTAHAAYLTQLKDNGSISISH